ncbi:unnamed protein product [Paramecium primaurelia]|uniref:Uncharacterized protein n=1 Tax=Paramecium primaurelia TaxID=5886 RepID=A0A8S1MNG9_PARPR|nr:unnamed protein product [Paramecium primaurelia]
MNDNHETFFFTQKQKRRIHEQDYAMKVVSHTKVDKETIQLSESLFNAKITAKQSSCIIRDIQRSVQQKIKFYDDYLRNSDSFRKQTDRKSLSPDIIKPKCIEQLLQSQNQHVSEQQITVRPNHNNNNQQSIQIPIQSSNSVQQSRKSQKQYTQSISPTKKQSQNPQRKKTTNNSSPQIKPKSNSQYVQQKERQTYYSKISTKEQEQKEQEIIQTTNRAQTSRTTAIAERNEEWKQKLKNKMDNQQKKQKQKQMADCTFKPRINNNQSNGKKYQKSASKEFQTEIKELMHLIDNQSHVKIKQ